MYGESLNNNKVRTPRESDTPPRKIPKKGGGNLERKRPHTKRAAKVGTLEGKKKLFLTQRGKEKRQKAFLII